MAMGRGSSSRNTALMRAHENLFDYYLQAEETYKQKEKVKKLGAKWDLSRKQWYVENAENMKPFLPYVPEYLRKPHNKGS